MNGPDPTHASANAKAIPAFQSEQQIPTSAMTWGLYPWFREHGMEYIHPDSRELVLKEMLYGRVFKLLDTSDRDWIEIEGSIGRLKVKPDLLLTVPSPRFDFGQAVQALPPRTVRIGTVAEVLWHQEKRRVFYQLTVEERRLSGRYWDDELKAVISPPGTGLIP